MAFQFVGRHFEEETLVRAGHAYQTVTDRHIGTGAANPLTFGTRRWGGRLGLGMPIACENGSHHVEE